MTSMGASTPDTPPRGAATQLMGDIMRAVTTLDGLESEFLPISDINNFTATPSIEEVLQDSDPQLQPEDIRKLSSLIQERPAKKVFLILVKCLMQTLIPKLLSTEFSDDDLPIKVRFDHDQKQFFLDPARNRPTRIELFKGDLKSAMLFEDRQWPLLAPIFQGSEFEYELNPKIPLPLIEKGPSQQSGFSSVRKVKVHRSHIEGEVSLVTKIVT